MGGYKLKISNNFSCIWHNLLIFDMCKVCRRTNKLSTKWDDLKLGWPWGRKHYIFIVFLLFDWAKIKKTNLHMEAVLIIESESTISWHSNGKNDDCLLLFYHIAMTFCLNFLILTHNFMTICCTVMQISLKDGHQKVDMF